MAAPTPTARQTPVGQPLRKGYQSLITFAEKPAVVFWEKGVTPPGMSGGDAIDSTTMHNGTYRTMGAAALVTLTDMSTRVAYNHDIYDEIVSLINVETTVTVLFATGYNLAFYGFLREFAPDEMVEDSQPEASITITPTNWDPVNFTEEAPVVGT